MNFAEIARLEKEEMAEEMAGLGVDEASGMKMFYTGNTLSAERRKEKLRQFKVVSDRPCDVRREGGQSLVIEGSSLVILEGKACNPL